MQALPPMAGPWHLFVLGKGREGQGRRRGWEGRRSTMASAGVRCAEGESAGRRLQLLASRDEVQRTRRRRADTTTELVVLESL